MAMLNSNPWQITAVTKVRLLQTLFLFTLLWFFFWAHIYEMGVWNKSFAESLYSSIPNVLIYLSSLFAIVALEIYSKRYRRVSPVFSASTAEEGLVKEKVQLKPELSKSRENSSNSIGTALLVAGIISLIASVVVSSTVIAFIGLGLTFWGALFLFARSTRFVNSTILGATNASFYHTLDRIVDNLNYKGKSLYVAPYPKDAYLPEHLSGLKEMTVFISSTDSTALPTIEEMAKKQFIVKNPEGICIIPPGSGLVSIFEKELRTDLTKIGAESFYENLPTIIVNNLQLASKFEIENENEQIRIRVTESVYDDLYSKDEKLKIIRSLGCPLISAVVCALAIMTGKIMTITQTEVFPNLKAIEVVCQVVEG